MPKPGHDMYYVAIICPPELDDRIHDYKLWMKENFGSKAALRSPAHITIIPPFFLEKEKETLLIKVMDDFISVQDPIQIELAGFDHFGKKVIVVKVQDNPQLQQLKSDADIYFSHHFKKEIKKEARSFHPHISIANRDIPQGEFNRAWDHFKEKKLDETFPARSLSLLKLSPGKWNVIHVVDWFNK